MFDHHASVGDNPESGLPGAGDRGPVVQTFFDPDRFRPHRHRLLDNLGDEVVPSEDLNGFDRTRGSQEVRI